MRWKIYFGDMFNLYAGTSEAVIARIGADWKEKLKG